MSIPCKFERSLLSYEEYETVRASHHPVIYDLAPDELHALRVRLRALRDKERTLARHKRREVRGKAEPRGGGFPGTAEHPTLRKRVFAGAVKRVNREFSRIRRLEARAALAEAAQRALALRRAGQVVHHPEGGDTMHEGMRSVPSRRRNVKLPRSKVGSVSQQTKTAQAVRDSRE